ncbi:hypothetical protein [Arthrobacter sp. NPDC090010]|uniref:hypothetical protein n=1 Tax=Arthrobacter sp. NPDC090010 TaxID=3363942 RepID=UPI00382D9099
MTAENHENPMAAGATDESAERDDEPTPAELELAELEARIERERRILLKGWGLTGLIVGILGGVASLAGQCFLILVFLAGGGGDTEAFGKSFAGSQLLCALGLIFSPVLLVLGAMMLGFSKENRGRPA